MKEKINITNQKNNEISSLLEEINSIKKIVKTEDITKSGDDVIKYINKIKKEKGVINKKRNKLN